MTKISSKIGKQKVYLPYRSIETYDGQEIDLLEINSQQEMQALEFKWAKGKSKIPAAFAKAYTSAKWNEVSKENYWD